MQKNKKTVFWIIGIALVLGALFAWPRLSSQNSGGAGSGVPCLIPNAPLLQHIHPVLKISVDGKNEEIPAGIGLGACERAIHTHADDAAQGVIHVESQDNRKYKLGDFFSVWGKTIDRDGFTLETAVDEELLPDPINLILEDGQQIVLKYSKAVGNGN